MVGEIWVTNKFVGLVGSQLELVFFLPLPKLRIRVVCLGSLLKLLLVFGEDVTVPELTVAPCYSTEGVLRAAVPKESSAL